MESSSLTWHNNQLRNQTTAILVPFYNEASDAEHFISRIEYFAQLAKQVPQGIDVILIDDGSSDGACALVQQALTDINCDNLSIARTFPNGQKVGALHRTIRELTHDFIVFTDFDTELLNLEALAQTYPKLYADKNCMGCYFKMEPVAGKPLVVKFQVIEYALERAAYKFVENEGSVAIMPGAGCLYKRVIVESLLAAHSGLRSGEDRETCLLGIEQGYSVFYEKNVTALTHPPQSLLALYKQRIRWSRGFLEVASSKWHFYRQQMANKTSLGKRHRADIISVIIFLCFPFVSGALFYWNSPIGYSLAVIWVLLGVLETFYIAYKGKEEVQSIAKIKRSLMLMPFARFVLEVPCWWGAISSVTLSAFQNKFGLNTDKEC